MSEIKIKRAMRAASIGRHPGSAEAMLDLIPASTIAALPSRELAVLLDAMWRACVASKEIAAREAIAEGALWDARKNRLREIAA